MVTQFFKLKVSNIIRETKDAVSITFDVPNELKEIFQFKQGQYVTLKISINGKEYRRDFSLSSSPVKDNSLTITVKQTNDGIVSTYLNKNICIGNIIEVMPPHGHFYSDLNPENENIYVLIGAGSGITPLMSNLKTILEIEPLSRVYLFYGNRNLEDIIFKKKLDEIKLKYHKRFTLIHSLSNEKNQEKKFLIGRLEKDKIVNLLNSYLPNDLHNAEYFICGPTKMMQEAENTLKELNINSEKIHKEYFVPPETAHELKVITSDSNNHTESTSPEAISPKKVNIILNNNEYSINVNPDQSILDAAIEAELDPPYSCKGGICSTCRAKLISGNIKMDEREGLSDSEIEEGYILTCQSHPLSDDVKIIYG